MRCHSIRLDCGSGIEYEIFYRISSGARNIYILKMKKTKKCEMKKLLNKIKNSTALKNSNWKAKKPILWSIEMWMLEKILHTVTQWHS